MLGPHRWADAYPQCSGTQQSPIDIEPNKCSLSKKRPIGIAHADYPPRSVKIINDRYTVKFLLNWHSNNRPFVHGDELGPRNRFIPREVHFHWGHRSDRGSEHRLEGRQYALEMHIVCFNERYGSVANATNRSKGVLVVSQLFRATKLAKKHFFTDFVDQVRSTGSEVETRNHLCMFAMDELIHVPPEEWNYIIYPGSFTTPPCYEQVTWLVFLSVQPVAEIHLQRLRRLRGLGDHIGDNYRPIPNPGHQRECLINTD